MHYLVASGSVHTTAAACDYLDPRLEGPTDTVTVCTVADGGRDAGDAANVARARLAGRATVEADQRSAGDGSVAAAVLDAVAESGADVLLVGPHAGEPGSGGGGDGELGSTARALAADATVPVVVLPLAALDAEGMGD